MESSLHAEKKPEIEGQTEERLGFEFDLIPFEGFSSTSKENLVRWGLDQSLVLKFFRFNIAFSDLDSQRFLQELLNSAQFQAAMPGFAAKAKKCTKITFNKLRVSMLNMNFLDSLESEGLIKKGGRIAPTFGEVIHSVEIVNLIRDAWLNEDGDHYSIFDEEMRREFLVQLFNLLVIGGSLNQYDDMIDPYRDTLREMYKEIVSVRKDGSNGAIYCESSAYQITQTDVRFHQNRLRLTPSQDEDVFKIEHPQNKLIVVVNPSKRECVVVKNSWR